MPQYAWAPQQKAEDLFQVLKEISAWLLAEDKANWVEISVATRDKEYGFTELVLETH